MKAREIIIEAVGVNYNTARSLAKDLHSYVQDMGFHLAQHGRDQHFQRLRQEAQDIAQDLEALGYDYDPKSPDHMRPLTINNQTDQKLSEAPLSDRAMQVLSQLKTAMDQPGEQVSQIQVPHTQEPQKDLATLQAEIRRLEKILAVANMIEKIAERIGRTRLGMDPGIEADLDIIRSWPVPRTDRDMVEMLAKYESTLEKFKRFLSYKKKVWGR